MKLLDYHYKICWGAEMGFIIYLVLGIASSISSMIIIERKIEHKTLKIQAGLISFFFPVITTLIFYLAPVRKGPDDPWWVKIVGLDPRQPGREHYSLIRMLVGIPGLDPQDSPIDFPIKVRRLAQEGDIDGVLDCIRKTKNLKKLRQDEWVLSKWAVNNNRLEVVSLLLERGLDVNETLKYGQTLLELAVKKQHQEIVNLLLQHEANVNIQDPTGRTVLHEAAVLNNQEILEELLEYGADPEVEDNSGITPIQLAMGKKLTDNLNLLKKFKDKKKT